MCLTRKLSGSFCCAFLKVFSMSGNETKQNDDISVYEFILPLLEDWKLIAFFVLLGVSVGTTAWSLKGFDAELRAVSVAKLDFVEWRRIVTRLPVLAESRAAMGYRSDSGEGLYQTLQSKLWWDRNVAPQYRYSKGDLKELGGLPKAEQDAGATQIVSVVFRGKGVRRDDAVGIVVGAERFVREGGLLLALKTLLEQMDLNSRGSPVDIQAQLSRLEIELDYLRKRALVLQKLVRQFPEKNRVSLQTVLDPKGDAARFLPLGTQQVAVESEISFTEEAIRRLRDQLESAAVSKIFVERALPLLKTNPDGFDFAEQLFALEGEIRKEINPGHKAKVAAIDRIANELSTIHGRFKFLFESDFLVSARRTALGLPVVLGLLGGLLAGVVFVFTCAAWRRSLREHRARVEGEATP